MARMAGPAWRPRGRHLRNSENMRVGVVVERRRIDHPWQEYSWRPVEIVPGAPTTTEWGGLHAGGGGTGDLAGAPGPRAVRDADRGLPIQSVAADPGRVRGAAPRRRFARASL